MIQAKVMVIGVHADDCEYGVGGTVKLMADLGCEVRFINTYPSKRMSTLPDVDMNAINKQNKAASELIGAHKIILGEDVRSKSFYKVTDENTELLENEINAFKPDIVFIQWPKDNHIEHKSVAMVSMNALFAAYVNRTVIPEIYAYECGPLQTMLYFYPDFYIDITSASEALEKCLKSFNQLHADGAGIWHEKAVSAEYRGHSAGADFKYAEAFKIIKFPQRGNDFLLRRLLEKHFRWNGNGMYPWGWQYFMD